MKTESAIRILAGSMFAAAAGLLIACGGAHHPETPDTKLSTQKVRVAPAREVTQAVGDEMIGTIRARSVTAISASVMVYVGTASPFNFNGLVRHYYLRQGSSVADITPKIGSSSTRKRQRCTASVPRVWPPPYASPWAGSQLASCTCRASRTT